MTAILPPKVWRRLEQAALDTPRWVAALSGSLVRIDAATHHRPDRFVIEPETERMH